MMKKRICNRRKRKRKQSIMVDNGKRKEKVLTEEKIDNRRRQWLLRRIHNKWRIGNERINRKRKQEKRHFTSSISCYCFRVCDELDGRFLIENLIHWKRNKDELNVLSLHLCFYFRYGRADLRLSFSCLAGYRRSRFNTVTRPYKTICRCVLTIHCIWYRLLIWISKSDFCSLFAYLLSNIESSTGREEKNLKKKRSFLIKFHM